MPLFAHEQETVATFAVVEKDGAIGDNHRFGKLAQAGGVTPGDRSIVDIVAAPASAFGDARHRDGRIGYT